MSEPTLDRRGVFKAAGVSAAAAAGLAACGSEGAVSDAAGSAATAAKSAAQSAAGAASSAVAEAINNADIPVGGGKIFDAIKTVVTQPTAGDYKAFSSICTHEKCPVTSISDGTINCSCHGSAFDIATGEVKKGPATKPLPAKSVSVSGDGLTVS